MPISKPRSTLSGPPPPEPFLPFLTCTEPTYEGLTKAFAYGWPSLGLFDDEAGQFIGGHRMKDETNFGLPVVCLVYGMANQSTAFGAVMA